MTHKSLSDQLRSTIEESGLSRYAICKTVGMTQSAMSRFMSRKGGLSLSTLDKLAELLKLDLVKRVEQSE